MSRGLCHTLDLAALVVLAAFGWTIRYTAQGAADPIWSALQTRGVLRVGTDPGFRPFAEQRDGQLTGYDIELATEVARRLDLRVEFVPLSYDALYDALSTRRVDLLAAALPLAPEQGWRARFSTAYLNAGQVLIVRRGAEIAEERDLAGHTVGVALGSDGDTLARRLHHDQPTLRIRTYETAAATLMALGNAQLDAVITDAVSTLAATEAQPDLEIASALSFEPYVLAMPVEAYRLEAAVDQALAAMRADGTIERLNARWFRPEQLH